MNIKTAAIIALLCFATLTFAEGKPEHAQTHGNREKHHDAYEDHDFDKNGRKSKDMRRNGKPRDPDRDFERPKQRRSGERPGRSGGRERAR